MNKDVAYLMINLGTPDSPSTPDVKKYLAEFLMDPRVIDIPKLARYALVHGIILNTRPKKSAHAYSQIWTDRGSPLRFLTEDLHQQVRQILPHSYFCMRYGAPSIAETLTQLKEYKTIRVLPLYPQFAWSSSASCIEKVREEALKLSILEKLEFLRPFYSHPGYRKALAKSVGEQLKKFSADYVLMSFHGIPERQLAKALPDYHPSKETYCLSRPDCCEAPNPAHAYCYRHQCFVTASNLAADLGLSQNQYGISFQSRLGRTPWLQPFSDFRILDLAKEQKIKRLAVVCPSFVSDCLETLEEIGMRAKSDFETAHPGAELKLITCLNTHPDWVHAIKDIFLAPVTNSDFAKTKFWE